MLEEPNVAQSKDKKIKDVYTRGYDVRKKRVFRPNRTVSNEIAARKQIPDGNGEN